MDQSRMLVLASVLAVTTVSAGGTIPQYRLVDLSAEIGESLGEATDVNDFGEVIGSTSAGLVTWHPTGDGWMVTQLQMYDTGGLCPFFEGVYAINNSGLMVGSLLCQLVGHAAILWDAGGVGQGIDLWRVPRDINDLGEVVGTQLGAWFWQGGLIEHIAPGLAWGINNHSVVVGRSDEQGAVMWTRNAEGAWELTDLGLGVDSSANAINDKRQITGGVLVTPETSHPFLWQDGKALDLGILPGFDGSYATAINELSQIVGIAVTLDFSNWRGFLWQQGTMLDLNDVVVSGPPLEVRGALGINESGQIAGWGKTPSAELHAILLDPVAPGDVDLDGDVDGSDFAQLLASWGACPECQKCPADLDGDCNVGIIDFLMLLGNWG